MWKCLYLVHLLMLPVKAPDHHPDHHPEHHHEPHGAKPDCHDPKQCELVNAALQNIGMYFDDHLCHAFKDVNCANHILTNDEQICGSDGRTYSNHCTFAKARCLRVLDHKLYSNGQLAYPLKIASHAPCGLTTVMSQSSSVTTGSGSTVPATATSAAAVPLTTTVASPSTSTNSTTTLATATTSSALVSTTMSTHSILGSVFCQYQTSINCGSSLTVVCGSNGKFYPNACELLKEQCVDPTLRSVADSTQCSLSP